MCTTSTPVEPTDLESAEEMRKQLTLDVQTIQTQLGDKQRTDDNGDRLSAREYWTWKKKAQHALNQKLNELRSVKQWIQERRRSSSSEGESLSATMAITHLANLLSVIGTLQDEGVTLYGEEKAKVASAKEFVDRGNRNREQQSKEQL